MGSGSIGLWSWRAAALVLQSGSPPLVALPSGCPSCPLQLIAAFLLPPSVPLRGLSFWPRSAVSLEDRNWALVWPVLMAQVICASPELQSQESSCSLRCLGCPRF